MENGYKLEIEPRCIRCDGPLTKEQRDRAEELCGCKMTKEYLKRYQWAMMKRKRKK